MNQSLKEKAISAASWHFVGSISRLVFTFSIGVILARLLAPDAFGIIGLATVFISVTNAFVDSGFSMALVQKKDPTQADYSTVFIFNILISLGAYFIIYFSADMIAQFFNEKTLSKVIRVLSIVILLYACNAVQLVILRKKLNYKAQTVANLIAGLVSGGIGIYMAYSGLEVWSLVWQVIINQFIIVVWHWSVSKWKPTAEFDIDSLKSLFAFGSKLLVTGIIYQIYNNLQSIIIGKFYSTYELGLYTRADRFQQISSRQISGTMAEITFPLFSSIQDDVGRLKKAVSKSIRLAMYISAPITLSMFVTAKPMILGLIGAKWIGSIEYLQLLCLYGLFFPVVPIITNVINAVGRSDIFMKLEIIRRILDIPILLIGAMVGIREMILAMIFVIIITILISLKYLKALIGYKLYDLLIDIKTSISLGFTIGLTLLVYLHFFDDYLTDFQNFIAAIFISGSLFLLFSELFKIYDYLYLKNYLLEKIRK